MCIRDSLVIERDELLGQPRLVGIVDDRLAALILLDLASALEQGFEIAVFVYQQRRGLLADAWHAGHCLLYTSRCV